MDVLSKFQKAVDERSSAAAIIVGAMFIVIALWFLLRPMPLIDPLGEYPVQSVDEVTLDHVTVTGTKCSAVDYPVDVTGSYRWQRADPPGYSSVEITGTGSRDPGCTTQTFENDFPEEVLRATESVGGVAEWRITGHEIPFVGGVEGKPRFWETEVFTVEVQDNGS